MVMSADADNYMRCLRDRPLVIFRRQIHVSEYDLRAILMGWVIMGVRCVGSAVTPMLMLVFYRPSPVLSSYLLLVGRQETQLQHAGPSSRALYPLSAEARID